MSSEEGLLGCTEDSGKAIFRSPLMQRSGFDPQTGVYHSVHQLHNKIPTSPDLDIATFVLSHFPTAGEALKRVALIDAATNQKVTYAQLKLSVHKLATGLYHGLGVKKGDVVFLLSPNCLLYPTICLAVLSIGAVLTTANPVNTVSEIGKQVKDSGAKLAIADPGEVHKLLPTGVPTLLTSRAKDGVVLSVEELIDCCDPLDLPAVRPVQSDTAVILYSSGTTGASKGVELTHSNLIAIVTLLGWSAEASSSLNDVFLCFIPMFHVYGLAFFTLGLLACGTTNVVMQKFDFQAMLEAIETYKVNNIPAVPPVILALVKNDIAGHDLSSLQRVGSGAAPLSKEVTDGFREKFPGVEVRQGYGLTESCGAAAFFPSDEVAKVHPGSCGQLLPTFTARIVHFETGTPLPPFSRGELWLKGPAPAELEAVLLSHPYILDAAVVPLEDEAAGEIPIAYAVKAADSDLTENEVIDFVATQVCLSHHQLSFLKSSN
ncbi:OLC1v1026167C1 [Oldenlandia corymbosa var. corymbosa]|uniref:OLC1v1026167C1 n=1 Tax=Oldenlandia corymbosa var. corymbosa TaxID=529605 RepID=A0AAV1C787_OLDCO|nr:OLC1v1026167C1 [Oldenlandia corymbosa var. corymbosa]